MYTEQLMARSALHLGLTVFRISLMERESAYFELDVLAG